MEISEQLLCLFSAPVKQHNESYVVEIPEQELRLGDIDEQGAYRIAVLPTPTEANNETTEAPKRERDSPKPPVEEDETRVVEIEDIGEQGDGIARIDRGYVVIVPDTETGERVRIEITDVRENVAFAEVVERVSYYD